MLYKILFYPSRLALRFYCRKIIVSDARLLNVNGPLLIAANHPNSFLDAVIVTSLFKKPVYSLARGDAFAGRLVTKLLTSCNMLPVYRINEGAENLTSNYRTFATCKKLFEQNKTVLIFSEGGCTNEWRLRSLKKGTARLALAAWQNGIDLKVLPLGINYSSFRYYGKNVHLNFGKFISKQEIDVSQANAKSFHLFNEKLEKELEKLVYEIDPCDYEKQRGVFFVASSVFKRIALLVPAFVGFLANAPLYFVLHMIIRKRAEDHYDAIMTGLLFVLYPLYTGAIAWIAYLLTKNQYSLLLVLLLPFTCWSYLQLKPQIKKPPSRIFSRDIT